MILDRIRKEPLVVLGIIGTVALAVIQSLGGQGVLKPEIVDTLIGFIDNTSTPVPLDGWGLLLIGSLVGRFFVYSPETVKEVAATAAATGNPTVRTGPP